jgi:PPOX class probable F420-dependent enzyme
MDIVRARRQLEDARIGRLGTITSDGRPHLVPCCFVLVGEVAYTAVDAKPKSTVMLRRIRNIEAHPATCLLVDHYEEDWSALWWVRLDGRGRIVDSPAEADDAKDALRAKYRQYRQLAIPGPVIAIDGATWTSWP